LAELWEIVLSIIGAGIVGYAIRWLEEKRRRTHEKETEYRKELKKHIPDLIEPLFNLLIDLWQSLASLIERKAGDERVVGGSEVNKRLQEVAQSYHNLHTFVMENRKRLDFLMPHALQSWQYARIESYVQGILGNVIDGKGNSKHIIDVINTIMKLQKDLQKVVGFEMKIDLESAYPFRKRPSRFERFKRKLKAS